MRCVFPACDYVADDSVSRNITLYKVPVEASPRAAWLEALGLVELDPEVDSGVCSKHFLMTRSGPMLRLDAVPSNVQRCRVCFARNCKLYSMKNGKPPDQSRLSYVSAYETLTGLSIQEEKPYLCMKCANQLLKCIRFRDRCIKAHTILMNINQNDNITCHDLLGTDLIRNETDSEYNDSNDTCTDELDSTSADCTDRIKSESIDIVYNDIVFPHVRSTKLNRFSPNVQDDSTNSVKTENNDIVNEEIETIDNLVSPSNLHERTETENNVIVSQNIASKEINNTYINRVLNMANIGGKSCKDNINGGSIQYESNKHSNCNRDRSEEVFRGENCSSSDIPPLRKATHKDKLSPKTLKKVTAIQKDLNQTMHNDERKLEATGGLLLRFILLTCDICNYQTVNKGQLMRHLKDHAAEKVYSCSKCYYLTNSKKSLLFHTEIHCNKKHTCRYCKKIFKFKCDLRSHLRIHTGEKPYSCDICTKKFRQYNQLAAHLKVHTGEKPHACDVCKKAFRQKGQLQSHSRIHSGEKPYSCAICSKAFIQRGQLQNHLNTHTDEKNYICDTCNKSFKVKGTLQNHMRVHAK